MDRELKSRIGGVQAQMTTFSFLFGLQLGYRLYAITDKLSRALQEKKLSAISVQRLARATLSTIGAMRNDEHDRKTKKRKKVTETEIFHSAEC